MGQVVSIPFSKVIATLLLNKHKVTSREVVNYMSEISQSDGNIVYDIYDDDLDYLYICIEKDCNMNFKIKDSMCYGTVLYDNVTVKKFLFDNSLKNENVRDSFFVSDETRVVDYNDEKIVSNLYFYDLPKSKVKKRNKFKIGHVLGIM